MKILYMSFDEVPSFKGASTHILCGLREVRHRHQVSLISLGEMSLRPSWGIEHTALSIAEKNIYKRGVLFRNRIAALLKKTDAEVLHFRSVWEGLPAVRSGLPCIYEVNGLPSVELPYYYRNIQARTLEVFRAWERECLDRARQVICPSERIARFLSENYTLPPQKIQLFPNAYDPLPVEDVPPRKANGTLRLVYLGTLSPWQGVSWSLKTIARFQGRVSLDIYAPGNKQTVRRFERRIRRFGLESAVRLIPPLHRAGLRSVLPAYDMGFAPFQRTARNTEQGCCPLKILDYLAHGLPVLAADLFVVREMLTQDANALLFHPGSSQSLHEAFTTLLQPGDPLAALRDYCRHHSPPTWTWKQYGEALSELYAEVQDTSYEKNSLYRSRSLFQEKFSRTRALA
jgi:glycosyltransferase involved in cell wall biosynthesis